jgi:peptidoglycan hydrolase CwlO-like protein
MQRACNSIVDWISAVVVLAVLTAGCHNRQRPAAEPNQVSPAAAAQAELQQERAGYEAEITSLQRQYNDILQQREAELATRENEIAALRQDIKKLRAQNAELRQTIKTVKAALEKLEEVVEPPTVPAEGER